MRVTGGSIGVGLGGYYADDLMALRGGAEPDGLLYAGDAVTPGHAAIRNPGAVMLVMLVDDDGQVGIGDSTTIQYAGVAGRDPVLDPVAHEPQVRLAIDELVAAGPLGFVDGCALIESLRVGGRPLASFVRYGISQALLSLHAGRGVKAEVIRDAYSLGKPSRVPLYAQSGEERYRNVDKMILKQVDEMPHGLINSPRLFGRDGEELLGYASWVRDRVAEIGAADYSPTLHFDVYGLSGLEFRLDVDRTAAFCERLAAACAPHSVRLEAPVEAGERLATARAMAALRDTLRRHGIGVELVADDWCNDLGDVELFLEYEAADMIQVKTPDLGAVTRTVEAALLIRRAGALVYIGGSCNETDLSARTSVHVAAAVEADVMLAKPGMGVDEGVMICRNEMERLLLHTELIESR